jgi:hypothetical protein
MLWNFKILGIDFGQYKTARLWESLDRNNDPIPWFSYPAIEYIMQLDFSEKTVFEFGSGNSTRFWAGRCKKVVSVDDKREWYNKMKGKLPDNVEYFLKGGQEYIKSISTFENVFDVIIIDGGHRYECAVEALSKLSDDGFIILDNSDDEEKASKLLRDADLIEVDMSGFGPIQRGTWTTSFYFRRNVRLTPAFDRQPIRGIGSETLRA